MNTANQQSKNRICNEINYISNFLRILRLRKQSCVNVDGQMTAIFAVQHITRSFSAHFHLGKADFSSIKFCLNYAVLHSV